MPATVIATDFVRNPGYWMNEALRQPVMITHKGRERLMLTLPPQTDAAPPLKGDKP